MREFRIAAAVVFGAVKRTAAAAIGIELAVGNCF